MPIPYLSSLNLNQNELQNVRLQNLATDPGSGVTGQIYYNTGDGKIRFYDGANWLELTDAVPGGAGTVDSVAAGSGIVVTGTNNVVVTHATPSSVAADSTNSGNTYIQSMAFDAFGHVESVTTGTITLASLGGDNYGSWTISDGTNSEAIGSGQTLTVDGTGTVTASYDSVTNTLTIDGTTDGTVTSVAVAGTDGIEVDSGSPITSSGTITLGVNATTLRSHLNVANGAEVNQNAFSTVAISGQSSVIADSATDTLTLIPGANISLTTNNVTDAITIASTDTTYTASNGVTISGTDVQLTGQASALHNLAVNGLIARTGSGTVAARTLTAGTGVSITNASGASGNPTITNSDRGSSQNIFKTLEADSGSAAAGSNNDSVLFKGGDGITTTGSDTSGDAIINFDVDNTVVRTTAIDQVIAGNKTFTGTTTFQGDIVHSGDYTLTAPGVVNTEDNILYLNSDYTNIAPVDDSGFVVNRGSSNNVGLIWDESSDCFAAIITTDNGTGTGNIVISSYAEFIASKLYLTNLSAGTIAPDRILVLEGGGEEIKTRTPSELRSDIGAGVIDQVNISVTPSTGLAINNTSAGQLAEYTLQGVDANTTTKGVVELATTTETRAMSDTARAVTPASLSGLRHSQSIGGATSIVVTHNLGTRDVIVQLYDNTTYETVYADIERTSTSTITVNFSTAPAANAIRVLIIRV